MISSYIGTYLLETWSTLVKHLMTEVMCGVSPCLLICVHNALVSPVPWPAPAPGDQWPASSAQWARCDVSNRRGEAASGAERGQWTVDTPRQDQGGTIRRRRGICVMVGNGGQDLITPGNDIPRSNCLLCFKIVSGSRLYFPSHWAS